ncbi:DUF3780 domain-containing protein [Anaerocolumna sedimenticola]|uniref:DUF3780 domain-containing protein n=1 Tax=Anaerocolumna sedimenticola TaxID=2696063 RepID=A0A6P1TPW5_9FIRM|nr:DUF3780 domain-containing protein [Anaerocolumna sedimenticola]QHQ63290.1 DUF3780 domain-containing protein [Anaerocolumna sedimenticola]
MAKIKSLGFGYIPDETKQHFLVVIPAKQNADVMVYERFVWDDTEEQVSELSENNCRLKVIISYNKWKLVQTALEREFNKTLKYNSKIVGKFTKGQIPVERLLGKEMMLLLWGIEKCDPSVIETATRNWLGLSREERWWMFTMTNANTGGAFDGDIGWRVAVRYALAENPIKENNVQGNLAEVLYSMTQ